MDSDSDFETVFETERELRSIERTLDRQRRTLYEELTAAFRRLNEDNLHDAADREYPLTEPEKRAVRRETTGPVRMLPSWEERYRELAADQREAREQLASFHEDVFSAIAETDTYNLTIEASGTKLDRPYLDLWVRDGDSILVLSVDNPDTEGYAYRTTEEYTEHDIENALQLLEGLDDIDMERFGFLVHDTSLVDDDVRDDVEDTDQLRARARLQLLEGLEAVDYEYIQTEDSPVLTFIETIDEYDFGTEIGGFWD